MMLFYTIACISVWCLLCALGAYIEERNRGKE